MREAVLKRDLLLVEFKGPETEQKVQNIHSMYLQYIGDSTRVWVAHCNIGNKDIFISQGDYLVVDSRGSRALQVVDKSVAREMFYEQPVSVYKRKSSDDYFITIHVNEYSLQGFHKECIRDLYNAAGTYMKVVQTTHSFLSFYHKDVKVDSGSVMLLDNKFTYIGSFKESKLDELYEKVEGSPGFLLQKLYAGTDSKMNALLETAAKYNDDNNDYSYQLDKYFTKSYWSPAPKHFDDWIGMPPGFTSALIEALI